MVINGINIKPGEEKKILIDIARLPSHSPIDMSITVSRAKLDGPVLLLTGGLHGDEVNGIEIVRRIIENSFNRPKTGTVICIPIINLYGFIHFSRYVPDGKDVNRSFPGNKNGSLASRVANYLTKDILPKIDYGIDFHTGGADRSNYPQLRSRMVDPKNTELSKVFNAPFSINSNFRPQSLRHTAAKLGKHILVYEGGESSRFDEEAIKAGIQGTLNVMRYLDMTDAAVEKDSYETINISKSSWLRAKVSGLFQSIVPNGKKIQKQELIGFITDPFGEFKIEIRSQRSGFVIGLNNTPIVHQGDALFHIGEY